VKLRLGAVAIALLLPALVLAHWSAATRRPGGLASPLSLPREVGSWKAVTEERLAPETLAIVEPDAYLMRRYEAPGRTEIWAYVAVYAGRFGYGKGAHDPMICYPALGWEILDTRALDVAVGGSEKLGAELVSVHKGISKRAAVYWFQPAGRWPVNSPREHLLRVFDTLAGEPQYAFVRLSGSTDESPTAVPDLAEFAGEIAPAVRAAVANVRSRDGERAEHGDAERYTAAN
jgi:EpsI family protein